MSSELSNIEYIEPEDLINIIDIIRNLDYDNEEQVPDYDTERESIDEYFSLLDRSKMDYYPHILDKASYLFININSHYFSNGNKRLSVASTAYFLEKNNYISSNIPKEKYREILVDLFGDFEFSDWDNFEAKDFGLYNLSIIIAMQNEEKYLKISSDDLKEKVKTFFEKTFNLQ